MRGVYPTELDEDGASIGAGLHEHFEPASSRSATTCGCRPRDVPRCPNVADWRDVVDSASSARRCSTTPSRSSGSTAASASPRAQPEGVHGHEDRARGALPVGGDSGSRDPRPRRGRAASAEQRGSVRSEDVWPSFVSKVLSFVDVDAIRPLRVVVDAANGMAGVMLRPSSSACPSSTSCAATSSPTELPEPPAEPASPREPRVHRREGRRGEGRPRGRVRRCRPLLLRRRHGRVRPGDFVTALLAEAAREIARREGDLRRGRAGPSRRRSSAPADPAREPRGPRLHQAAHARRGRGSPARSRRTTTSATSRRPIGRRAVSSCSSCSRSGRRRSRAPPPYRERFFLTGEINTPVADVPLKLQELKERYTAEGGASHLDGISFDFDDWHFNVRRSNTEPLLRLNLEALGGTMVEKRDEVLELIRT